MVLTIFFFCFHTECLDCGGTYSFFMINLCVCVREKQSIYRGLFYLFNRVIFPDCFCGFRTLSTQGRR